MAKLGCFTVARAVFVRMLFTAHGLFSIWRLYDVTGDANNWYLTTPLIGLLMETALTLYKKRGQEWKWFCPSVFFYLLCLVPTIWFLELDEMEKRIKDRATRANSTTPLPTTTQAEDYLAFVDIDDDKIFRNMYSLKNKIKIENRELVRLLEQILLLILILGRWLLPKGKLTHDQLSQLLLVYIGTAADIVEFFEAFNEEQVKFNRDLCKVILSIWSWSVLQFTLVFTATKAPRREGGGATAVAKVAGQPDACCTPDVFGIIMSIFMQDGPFLVLRMLLIIQYNVTSYTNMFFTCKNTLVCMLLMYRLIVIQIERYKTMRAIKHGGKINASESRARLLLTSCSTDQFYNYSTKINLRETTTSDPIGPTVPFVVIRHVSFAESETTDHGEDTRTLASEPGVSSAAARVRDAFPLLSSTGRRAGSCGRLTDVNSSEIWKMRGRRMAIDMGASEDDRLNAAAGDLSTSGTSEDDRLNAAAGDLSTSGTSEDDRLNAAAAGDLSTSRASEEIGSMLPPET